MMMMVVVVVEEEEERKLFRKFTFSLPSLRRM